MSAILQPLHGSSAPLDIRRVAGRIGAEIRGVAVSGALDAATVAASIAPVSVDGRRSRARETEAREAA